jgi:hypothetical protein
MGSGSLLFTNTFNGAYELFGKNVRFCFYYLPANVVSRAKLLHSTSGDKIDDIIGTAKELINNKHRDVHRLEELYNIIEEYKKTKRIVRKWRV